MGAILGLALTGLAVWGLFSLATSPDARRKALAEFRRDPGQSVFVLLWYSCILGFMWGVFVWHSLAISTPLGRVELWKICGVLSVVGLVAEGLFFGSRRRR